MNTVQPNTDSTDRTMVVFRLGVEAGQHQAAFSARLNALLPRAIEIAFAEGDERTLAAARLAAQATR